MVLSRMAVTFYTFTNFSTSLPTFGIVCFSDDSHSNTYEVIFHCDLDFHFPDN